MAAAIDLTVVGRALFECNLANLTGGRITVVDELLGLGEAATDEALKTIASLFLKRNPPPWLYSSTVEEQFHAEFVPSGDLAAIEWLGDDLSPILYGAAEELGQEDRFRSWLGSAGESLVVATERHDGAIVRHVSRISDHFGYDVESSSSSLRRIEVKTSILSSEHRVFLTRNEANTAKRYPGEWCLVQVILTPGALTSAALTQDHVQELRRLSGTSLLKVLPQDTQHCRWRETVELKTAGLAWERYVERQNIPATWHFEGFLL